MIPSFSLNSTDIHIWVVNQIHRPLAPDACRNILSPEEKYRADRFHFERDRNAFITVRTTLRFLLGKYLGREPSAVVIDYNRYGKPFISFSENHPGLHFNLSHSKNKAVLAFSSVYPLGVDLEYLRTDLDFHSIAERFFSTEEFRRVSIIPRESQVEAFFFCWTRKEAFMKAKGLGLSMDTTRFSVPLAPGEGAGVVGIPCGKVDSGVYLYDIDAGSNYAASLAVPSRNVNISVFHWADFCRQRRKES